MTDRFDYLSDGEFEELRQVFYSEAHEIVQTLQELCLRLDIEPGDGALLKEIKRYLHTLKGDSNSFGLASVGTLCHRIEDILSSLLGAEGHAGHEAIDLLLHGVDSLKGLLIANERGEGPADEKEILDRIDGFMSSHKPPPRLGSGEAPGPEPPPSKALDKSRPGNEMLRVEASKVDRIMNLVGELIIGRSMMDRLAREIEEGARTGDVAGRLFAANSYMERTVSDLQKSVMKMRMVPINHVFRRFPKIVRDLSAEKSKKVLLEIQGRETELDRSVVEALNEPLLHIIRNIIDHGIEEPRYRRSIGKSEEGVITLRAYHEASRIVVEAADDGKGIDTPKLKKKAAEGGLISPDDMEGLSEKEALDLIFLSGLSTSDAISETSGRGIGMDAVKSAVDGMKGSIEVESTPGKGTLFRLRLPLTLAVIKGLLVEAGGRIYAVPLSAVVEVARVGAGDLTTVDGRDTLLLRDRTISIIRLDELFGINASSGAISGKKFALILGIAKRRVGILIDRLAGQQELVIKAVDDRYSQSGLVSGASITGDGKVVLILDPPAIFGRAVEDERSRCLLHEKN